MSRCENWKWVFCPAEKKQLRKPAINNADIRTTYINVKYNEQAKNEIKE
jgi:hypothetical protein